MRQLKLYDTTLRDGLGTPGLSLSLKEKVEVVRALDNLGVHMIEAGFPSSNPKEVEFFELLDEMELLNSTICAFGMTRRRDVPPEEDLALRALVRCSAPVVTLVGKTWGLHLEKVTRVSREENLAMIFDSVSFCRSEGKRVVYDAEHFFDAYADDCDYALRCLQAAIEAGAESVCLCDTNGSSLPHAIEMATRAVVEAVEGSTEVGIHTHDDAGCAVANSLVAVEAGASMVQGTLNGYGERCGNANLSSILPSLQLKMGYEVVTAEKLESLSRTSHYVDEVCNMTPDPSSAYVGWHAFMHKAGMHSAAVEADPKTFEHIDPLTVGNQGSSTPSELSGKGTIRSQARKLGIYLDEAVVGKAVALLKEREHAGYHYEAAPASFELMLRRLVDDYRPLADIKGFKVVARMMSGECETEATVSVADGDNLRLLGTVGNGPVHALDEALRGTVAARWPEIKRMKLTDYKVRIVESAHGADAVIRVLLESTDGEREWSTIGVSGNVIEASWEALLESYEYALQPVSEPVT
jgi:2-isopropylmalate synthase